MSRVGTGWKEKKHRKVIAKAFRAKKKDRKEMIRSKEDERI